LRPRQGSPHASDTNAACAWLRKNLALWSPWVTAAQGVAREAEAARVEARNKKPNITIGGLFAVDPSYSNAFGAAENGYIHAATLAVQHVNADDGLLPTATLRLAVQDATVVRALSSEPAYSWVKQREVETLVDRLQVCRLVRGRVGCVPH
jgi:hypothetical protein